MSPPQRLINSSNVVYWCHVHDDITQLIIGRDKAEHFAPTILPPFQNNRFSSYNIISNNHWCHWIIRLSFRGLSL